jgi:hypothetical protein
MRYTDNWRAAKCDILIDTDRCDIFAPNSAPP